MPVHLKIQLVSVAEDGSERAEDVLVLTKQHEGLEQLGLTLAEGKQLLRELQRRVVQQQATAFLTAQKACPTCGRERSIRITSCSGCVRCSASSLWIAGVCASELERLKWFLWHGNVFRALQVVEMLELDLDDGDHLSPEQRKLLTAITEFGGYLRTNASSIPNYGERYRAGETISSAFVESAVNQVVSKRMVKKQQMRWTPKGAHLLLQVRTTVLNDELSDTFGRWYPAFVTPTRPAETEELVA
jgi:hypothetical protein